MPRVDKPFCESEHSCDSTHMSVYDIMCAKIWFFTICFLIQSLSFTALAIDVISGKPTKSDSIEKSKNSNPSSFSPATKRHAFYVGLNTYSKSILKTTSTSTATKDLLSPIQFPQLLGYTYAFNYRSRLVVFLDYTLLTKSGPDSNQKETNLLLRTAYSQVIQKSDWEWKAGLLIRQTKIIGEGGTLILNNGSSTATFYSPGNTSTSNIFASEIGINYFFKENFSWQSSLLIEAPLNTKKRNFSLLTGLVYEIGSY